MNKYIKVGGLLIFIAALSVVSGCKNKTDLEGDDKPKKQVIVQNIQKDTTVDNSLVVSGTVVPKQYSLVRSLTPGTVEYLAPVGSEIIAGQSLYSVRDANIEDSFFSAQRSLDQTQIISSQRVTQAELGLSSAKAQLELAKSNADIAERRAEQNTETAIDATILSYNSAYNALNQSLTSITRGSLTGSSYTYSYKSVLTTNSSIKNQADVATGVAVSAFSELDQFAIDLKLEEQIDAMINALQKTKSAIDLTSLLLQSTIVGQGFTQATLDSSTVIIATYQTQINQYSNTIISSKNNLKNTVLNTDLAVQQAENQLYVAEIQYKNAEIAFDNADEGAALEENIVQRQFDAAAYQFSNLSLPSPFTGTVLSHLVSEGEQTSVGREIIEIGNISIVEISLELDGSFGKGLALGDSVLIDDQYDGFVSELEPAGDIQSGKIGVVVQADNSDNNLVAGSIANVKFSLEFEVDKSIIIPIKSATIEEIGTTVLVVEDGFVRERTITLGQVYGNKVTVNDGLLEGDQLILANGIFISEGEEVEIK